jgi:hypothetical protein
MEREEPWLDPISAAEALWYRGFLYRGFDETAEDLVEFYYIPNELLSTVPDANEEQEQPESSALLPLDILPETIVPSTTYAVDDLTTLLAITLQMSDGADHEFPLEDFLLDPDPDRRSLLLTLATEIGLVRSKNGTLRPTRAAVDWLKKTRNAQLFALADAWSNSDWNDLCHTPDLRCEGEKWQNDPILARSALLDILPRTAGWYQVHDLVDFMKQTNPDFQRPDGNYDTWYIRDAGHEGYLVGFDAWEHVEGRLLRFLIQGPLFWLGMVELSQTSTSDVAAFKLSDRALNWLSGRWNEVPEHQPLIHVQPDGTLLVPLESNRYLRFQVARIGEGRPLRGRQSFRFNLTPRSLARAAAQGITGERALQFLAKASGKEIPRSVQRAVERWQERGVEARLETMTVLRVNDENILNTLRNNPRTRDFIGESLGDLAVEIKPGSWEEFCKVTAQLGLLLDAG